MSGTEGRDVDVGGHPTWFHRSRSGPEKVLLLHGGLSCSEEILDLLRGPVPPRTVLPLRRARPSA